MNNIRVLFTTNVPSPYRVDFFNELGRYCDLTVLFEKETSSDRDDKWVKYDFINFKGIILNGKSVDVDKAFCPSILKYLNNKKYDFIIIANTITPSGILSVFFMKLLGIGYYLEADGAIVKKESLLKKQFKKSLMKGATGYFSSSKSLDMYFIKYGAEKEKIYRYPFSSVLNKDIKEAVTEEQRQEERDKLKISENHVVLCVGQFIFRKGFDVLLNIWNAISGNTGLYIVGGDPTEEYLRIVAENKLKNVHFVAFKGKDELNLYYAAADVFVLPTREDIWGLVVNEALSKGVPVITTNKCVSGLEMIENGKNGYIVPVEDGAAVAKRINQIVEDTDLRMQLSKNAIATARKWTIEEMAAEHIKIINRLVNLYE